MVDVALGVAGCRERLRRLSAGHGSPTDLAEADWTPEDRLDIAIAAVGLEPTVLSRTVASLSGGERTKFALAKAQIECPDLLLLDEPTNNLDAAGRKGIRDPLAKWPGGVVVASHDRELLEGVDRILSLAGVGWEIHGGGWSAYVAAREAARQRAATELERAEREHRAVGLAVQLQRERKARRDRQGKAWRAKGIDAKVFLDAERGRAERSAARDDQERRGRLMASAISATPRSASAWPTAPCLEQLAPS